MLDFGNAGLAIALMAIAGVVVVGAVRLFSAAVTVAILGANRPAVAAGEKVEVSNGRFAMAIFLPPVLVMAACVLLASL